MLKEGIKSPHFAAFFFTVSLFWLMLVFLPFGNLIIYVLNFSFLSGTHFACIKNGHIFNQFKRKSTIFHETDSKFKHTFKKSIFYIQKITNVRFSRRIWWDFLLGGGQNLDTCSLLTVFLTNLQRGKGTNSNHISGRNPFEFMFFPMFFFAGSEDQLGFRRSCGSFGEMSFCGVEL